MPKGREEQELRWACDDCKYNKSTTEVRNDESVNEITVKVFECLHRDPMINEPASETVLATCDSWEAVDDEQV